MPEVSPVNPAPTPSPVPSATATLLDKVVHGLGVFALVTLVTIGNEGVKHATGADWESAAIQGAIAALVTSGVSYVGLRNR